MAPGLSGLPDLLLCGRHEFVAENPQKIAGIQRYDPLIVQIDFLQQIDNFIPVLGHRAEQAGVFFGVPCCTGVRKAAEFDGRIRDLRTEGAVPIQDPDRLQTAAVGEGALPNAGDVFRAYNHVPAAAASEGIIADFKRRSVVCTITIIIV